MASEVKSENNFMQVLSNPQNLGKFYAVRVLNTCHIQGDPPKIDLEILWIAVNCSELARVQEQVLKTTIQLLLY